MTWGPEADGDGDGAADGQRGMANGDVDAVSDDDAKGKKTLLQMLGAGADLETPGAKSL